MPPTDTPTEAADLLASGEVPATDAAAPEGTDQAAPPPEPPPEPPKAAKKVEARVLVDCAHGVPNSLALLTKAELKLAEDAGEVDSAKEAVAYAKSLIG